MKKVTAGQTPISEAEKLSSVLRSLNPKCFRYLSPMVKSSYSLKIICPIRFFFSCAVSQPRSSRAGQFESPKRIPLERCRMERDVMPPSSEDPE